MARTLFETGLDELVAASAKQPYDCIVVGGGSSGLTAARTLAEHGRRVAVLEAGPAPFLTHISNTELRFSRALSDNLRNQTQYAPKLPDGTDFGPNFSCLGGRGLFWNGAAPRFRSHDFEGWPFDASELEVAYQWAEHEFRVSRAIGETRIAAAVIALLRREGIPAEAAPFAVDPSGGGEGTLTAGIASGLGVFLRGSGAAVARGEIHVATRTMARRVLIADGAARGVSASASADGSSPKEILSRAVVLAGGCVESIRLAKLSGVPDPSNRIGVGLQDHIFYRVYFDAPHCYPPDRPSAGAVYVPSSSQADHQWEIHAPGRRLFGTDDGTRWAPVAGEAYQMMVRSFAATEKRDANFVEVQDGPLGSARIHFTWSAADETRRAAMDADAKKLAGALQAAADTPRIAQPGGSYHEAGGLDMGSDSGGAVLASNGRFHRVQQLYCFDAAAFPRIGATNPHLTIVAVSRRQATLLARDLARS